MAGRQLHLLQSTLSLNRVNQLPIKRRTFHLQFDPLTSYTDSKLRCRHRFGRDAIDYIVGLVADDIMPETNRNHAVSAEMQLLITLRYLASGSFLQVIGDTFLGFDKSAVSRVVHRVTQALSAKVGNFVKFPSTRAERDEIKQGLFRVGGFPCAIGCIDGTHVRITAPHENEPDFVNRKGYHSINVQAICNHRGKQIRPLLNLGFSLHQGFLSCEQLARSLSYSAIKSGIRKQNHGNGNRNGNVLTLWLEWEIVKFWKY